MCPGDGIYRLVLACREEEVGPEMMVQVFTLGRVRNRDQVLAVYVGNDRAMLPHSKDTILVRDGPIRVPRHAA